MFAHINGVQLFYEVKGTGPPVMVVSGGGIPFYQRTFSHALQQRLQFIFVELRATGRSTGKLDDVTFEVLADDMDALRQALNLERITVLGHSVHGFVAMAYAANYRHHTSHLILMGTVPKMPGYAEAVQDYWETSASQERKTLLQRNNERLAEVLSGNVSPDEALVLDYAARSPMLWYDPTFDSRWLWAGSTGISAGNQHFGKLLLPDYDPTPSFAQIICPVFIAAGQYDFGAPPTLWKTDKDRFPKATMHVFEHSGHNPQLEEQALFDARLLDWLDATSSADHLVS